MNRRNAYPARGFPGSRTTETMPLSALSNMLGGSRSAQRERRSLSNDSRSSSGSVKLPRPGRQETRPSEKPRGRPLNRSSSPPRRSPSRSSISSEEWGDKKRKRKSSEKRSRRRESRNRSPSSQDRRRRSRSPHRGADPSFDPAEVELMRKLMKKYGYDSRGHSTAYDSRDDVVYQQAVPPVWEGMDSAEERGMSWDRRSRSRSRERRSYRSRRSPEEFRRGRSPPRRYEEYSNTAFHPNYQELIPPLMSRGPEPMLPEAERFLPTDLSHSPMLPATEVGPWGTMPEHEVAAIQELEYRKRMQGQEISRLQTHLHSAEPMGQRSNLNQEWIREEGPGLGGRFLASLPEPEQEILEAIERDEPLRNPFLLGYLRKAEEEMARIGEIRFSQLLSGGLRIDPLRLRAAAGGAKPSLRFKESLLKLWERKEQRLAHYQ